LNRNAPKDSGRRVPFTRIDAIVLKLKVTDQDLQLPSAPGKLDQFELLLNDLSYAEENQAKTGSCLNYHRERRAQKSSRMSQ
jgi:hypothetical protein